MRRASDSASTQFADVPAGQDGLACARPARSRRRPRCGGLFAESLAPSDEVALEATCNTQATARVLKRHVARVVVSNPAKTCAIAERKVKTDNIDTHVLYQLLAVGSCSPCGCPTTTRMRCAGRSPAGHIVRQAHAA